MAGRLFIVSAPSGAGKTTLVHKVIERLKHIVLIDRVITFTTKAPRPGEVDGIDYHFLSPQEFELRIAQNYFIEWSTWYGHYYGSPRSILEDMRQGKSYIMIVDLPGALSIKELILNPILIWIATKDANILKERLASRNADSAEQIKKRLELAQKEIEQEANNKIFDYRICNDQLLEAIDSFELLVRHELGIESDMQKK